MKIKALIIVLLILCVPFLNSCGSAKKGDGQNLTSEAGPKWAGGCCWFKMWLSPNTVPVGGSTILTVHVYYNDGSPVSGIAVGWSGSVDNPAFGATGTDGYSAVTITTSGGAGTFPTFSATVAGASLTLTLSVTP